MVGDDSDCVVCFVAEFRCIFVAGDLAGAATGMGGAPAAMPSRPSTKEEPAKQWAGW